MSVLQENLSSFRKGMSLFKQRFEGQLIDRMYDCAIKMVLYAIEHKNWAGFTGNAQTSFTIGIFRNGSLLEYMNGEIAAGRKSIRKKIQKGERVRLKRPFEGRPRTVVGQVEVTNQYATDSALDFLKSYKAINKGLSMVVTIGVEYYLYLENGESGVLSYVHSKTKSFLEKLVWKQIKV